MRKLLQAGVVALLPRCEETNHVNVDAPREFVGAVVDMRRNRDDGTIHPRSAGCCRPMKT
jgi:hypothetical protein